MTATDGAAHQEWVRQRPGVMRTPRVIVEAQVLAATGRHADRMRRLLVGEDNEVYDVTTTGGSRVIVRISHSPDPRFEAERWAMDAARAAGVPTPRVLHLQHVTTDDDTTVTFCIEEKLRGIPLDVLLDRGVRPERAIGQLGELLSAVHGIAIDGFGYLQPDGRGWPITFASIMLDLLPRHARLLQAAQHWQVDAGLVEAGLYALASHPDLYRYGDPRLVHGDLSLAHVLVEGDPGHERVSGILDMQNCAGGHPASDLAHWLLVCHQRVPLSAMLDSYPGGADFAEQHAQLIMLMMVRQALWMLMVDQDRGNPTRIGEHVRALQQALAALERPLR